MTNQTNLVRVDSQKLRQVLRDTLLVSSPSQAERVNGLPDNHLRQVLREALISSNAAFPQPLINEVNNILKQELQEKSHDITDASLLPIAPKGPSQSLSVSLWRGDITLLKVDAIVNAANSALLGCFQPTHRCIDNVIHDKAGPALRAECRDKLSDRDSKDREEPVGKAFTTGAHCLPSKYIIHTVGPQAQFRGHEQPKELSSCYWSCLEEATRLGVESIAFCCISTGLFGYPPGAAARVAVETVRQWAQEQKNKEASGHPSSSLKLVIFNVFTDVDEQVYHEILGHSVMTGQQQQENQEAALELPHHPGLEPSLSRRLKSDLGKAAKWFHEADAVLVCAGAGMSANPGYNVYVDTRDFKQAYPGAAKLGYRSSYEAMGLFFDPQLPEEVRWGYQATHMMNQRWRNPINEGYAYLRALIGSRPYFVYTSNVDGHFERSGLYDKNKIYTPQGDWAYYQCLNKCRKDSVWPSEELIRRLYASTDSKTQRINDPKLVPSCPNCGGRVFGNVRGGGWFLHHKKYDLDQERFTNFVKNNGSDRLLIIEIGAGFNTPTVTRFPMEAISRNFGARLIRINPSDPEVPKDLGIHGLSLPVGWEALVNIFQSS